MNKLTSTLAAAVAMMVLCRTGHVLAEATYTEVDGNYVFELSSDDTYSGVLSGGKGLVKKGAGKLTLSGANTFTGAISIEGGTLAATAPSCFGKPSSISVGAGAVFDITPASSSDATGGSLYVDVTLGANATLRRSSGGAINNNIIKSLILQGDATLDMGKRFRIGSFVLNGYKLTKSGSGEWVCSNSSGSIKAADADGRIASVQVDAGYLIFQSTFKLEGSPANKIIWNTSTGRMQFYDQSGAHLAWPVIGNQDTFFQASHSTSPNQNLYSGPVLSSGKLVKIECGGNGTNVHVTNDLFLANGIKLWGTGGIAEISNTGVLTNFGTVSVNGSNLRFSGRGEKVFKANWIINEESRADRNHHVELLDAGDVVFPASKWVYFKGPNLTYPAMMTISNTVFRFPVSSDGQLRLGSAQNGMNILRIQDGAVITSKVYLAANGSGSNGTGSRNAVYMTGGSLAGVSGSDALYTDNALNASGYFELSGGAVERQRLIMGTCGTGFYHQKGGSFSVGNSHVLSQGGRGTLRMTDGAMTCANLYLGSGDTASSFASAPNAGRSLVVLSGAGTSLRATVVTQERTNTFSTVLAVNGGARLAAKRICSSLAAKKSAFKPEFHISFDGGVLVPCQSYDLFDTNDNSKDPDSFVIQSCGIVVDTSESLNYNSDIPGQSQMHMPLTKPTGKVVKAIALPAEAANATTYCGPATVTINGAGCGAAAVAEFDSVTRRITGITVVARGTGYDDATTATIESPDGTSTYSCTVTMEDASAAGGLTKRGAQALHLYGANTYGGPTRCEQGDLVFQTQPSTYPGGDLELAGGVIWFDIGGTVALSCTVRGTCADIFGGQTMVRATETLDLSNVTFEVTDPENLSLYRNAKKVTVFSARTITGTPTLSANYGPFNLHASGGKVSFGCEKGTTILFR